MTDFPLGALLIHTYLTAKVMFERECDQCQKHFSKTVAGCCLSPPLFKDMWMRPEQHDIYRHHGCLTNYVINKD
jgi:hypothetical protein